MSNLSGRATKSMTYGVASSLEAVGIYLPIMNPSVSTLLQVRLGNKESGRFLTPVLTLDQVHVSAFESCCMSEPSRIPAGH